MPSTCRFPPAWSHPVMIGPLFGRASTRTYSCVLLCFPCYLYITYLPTGPHFCGPFVWDRGQSALLAVSFAHFAQCGFYISFMGNRMPLEFRRQGRQCP